MSRSSTALSADASLFLRSLDNIYKKAGPIAEDVLGKIALAVVSGLTYLYDVHRIIHRGSLVPSSADCSQTEPDAETQT
jgi:hypothetical protein